MKKQTTTTPTTKNFCAAISTELSDKLDKIAAQNNIKNKPALVEFLAKSANENTQLKQQVSVLRYENIPYKIECFIVSALKKSEPITKQSVQDYLGKKVNLGTIDAVLCHYLNEILEHAQKHNYGTQKDGTPTPRRAAFISGLETAKNAL